MWQIKLIPSIVRNMQILTTSECTRYKYLGTCTRYNYILREARDILAPISVVENVHNEELQVSKTLYSILSLIVKLCTILLPVVSLRILILCRNTSAWVLRSTLAIMMSLPTPSTKKGTSTGTCTCNNWCKLLFLYEVPGTWYKYRQVVPNISALSLYR